MITRTLEELRAADERTQLFTPFGLGITLRLTPEAALAHQHAMLDGTDLVDEVAEGTRLRFERVRTLYLRGVLDHESFTVAGDHARLVVEHALRDRFLSFYRHRIVLVSTSSGHERIAQVDSFDKVRAAFERRGGPWKLKLTIGGVLEEFNGMLNGLWNWAREEGLLPGQRARSMQPVQIKLRNMVAHPSGYHLGTPVDAARVIHDLAEIINCLWGARTPGGRLHPAPVHRSVQLIIWDDTGRVEIGDITTVPTEHMTANVTCLVVRAQVNDRQELLGFDPRFETTRYPVELLWGPGTVEQARVWVEAHRPVDDEVDTLDRHFVIRRHGDRIDPPRGTAVTAGLPTDQRAGVWLLVKADDPLSAFNHIRNQTGATSACTDAKPCTNCPAHTVTSGDWETILQHAAQAGLDTRPVHPANVQVPSPLPSWTAES
ncbi:hypothetical protein [Saccharothrix syringae]|uniref:Uncharacterized protein n=1 Tax=Saccharothrix syringae TaxID=103733 RepID=A0A5Q0H2K7_SACSY|nr:hypothetical protein [Saccharothrix syringae]QFZ20369.1 hypothetical protein EKG83_25750 [Saccharothrix syringae]